MKWIWEKVWGLAAESLTRQRLKALSPTAQGMEVTVMTLPSFHREPQPPVGVKESRDLTHAHPELVRRYLALKADYERETGKCMFETCTWRSKERQFEIFKEGRIEQAGEWVVVDKTKVKTKLDGFKKKGRHNVFPSEAVDVAIDADPGPGKHIVWDKASFAPLGALAIKHGLIWGGDWNRNGSSEDESFIDAPHLELPAEAA